MAEYLEEKLKRMSPGVRRTRRKETEIKNKGGKRTNTEIRKETAAS